MTDATKTLRLQVRGLYDQMQEIEAEIAAVTKANDMKLEAQLRPLRHKLSELDESMNAALGEQSWIIGRLDADGLPILEKA